jgi:hypothetical protein
MLYYMYIVQFKINLYLDYEFGHILIRNQLNSKVRQF